MTMEEFRDNLLKYLFIEKKLEEEDAEKQKNMSREEKVENNLLLINVTIKNHEDDYIWSHGIATNNQITYK